MLCESNCIHHYTNLFIFTQKSVTTVIFIVSLKYKVVNNIKIERHNALIMEIAVTLSLNKCCVVHRLLYSWHESGKEEAFRLETTITICLIKKKFKLVTIG